jgi:orotate phosphoribosyltransferase
VTAKDRLVAELRAHALVIGEVVLTSGQTAQYYVDAKRAVLLPAGFAAMGELVAERAAAWGATAVGGLTMGADPVAAAMLHAASRRGRQLDAFVVRKAEKAHGLQQRIEGPSISGRRVVVVEDTSTTGGSPLTAVEAAREAGAEVVAVAVIADRASGAQEKIEAQGLPYLAAYSVAELGLG